jgi:hypothetical protein
LRREPIPDRNRSFNPILFVQPIEPDGSQFAPDSAQVPEPDESPVRHCNHLVIRTENMEPMVPLYLLMSSGWTFGTETVNLDREECEQCDNEEDPNDFTCHIDPIAFDRKTPIASVEQGAEFWVIQHAKTKTINLKIIEIEVFEFL